MQEAAGDSQAAADRTVVVAGGGLAGLAAATTAARAGARVLLVEAVTQIGGRARTREEDGFRFNMGAHALYAAGAGMSVLRELDVRPSGREPASGGLALKGERGLHRLPAGPLDLLATRLLGWSEKLELSRLMARLAQQRPEPGTTLREWLHARLRGAGSRALLESLVRLTTYAHAPERIEASAALEQLALGLRGVLYLEGGWQSLVAALEARAHTAGVQLRSGQRAVRVLCTGERVSGVELAGGERIGARAVILATGPGEAERIAPCPALRAWAAQTTPVRAACLDLGLAALPVPSRTFAIGVDRPLYLSVHSTTARDLAPAGSALVHTVRYLHPDEDENRERLQRELEALLDRVQPGWPSRVVSRKLLIGATVSHWLPEARTGGLAGRPGPEVPGLPGLLVAGDWVGSEGLLADAALASGRAAGQAAAARAGEVERAA